MLKANINNANILKAREREYLVIELLQKHKYLTSKHLCNFIPWRYDVCTRTLLRMAASGEIKRWRSSKTSNYIYYLGKRTENMNHWLLLASTYCYLVKKYRIKHWETELQFSMIRPDGYTRDLNAFVEVDLATNPFNKVPLYHRLYESDEWITEETPKKEGAFWFPRIIVVTARKNALLKRMEQENQLGLDFVLLDKEI